ncbi:Protein of unknown function [Propionibacterium freudenreichii]|nr:Protein of unknown function [Propionibacterium freudenreichii]
MEAVADWVCDATAEGRDLFWIAAEAPWV